MNFVVLTMLLNATSGISNDIKIPQATRPGQATVEVQAILCGSLAGALLAAFLAMLGKQWLNLHVDGSFIDRNRHRELKMSGMVAWRFKMVMECLPLIMQGSLLLLGYALARYFWDLNRTASLVVIGFTAFGLVFYISTLAAGTASKACPFQTPASVFLRTIPERYGEDIRAIIGTVLNFFGLERLQQGLIAHRHQALFSIASDVEDRENRVRADSRCIRTMFRMTKASDSIMAIMAYIPEITWDSRLRSVPLLLVYRALLESLWRSVDKGISPRPGARDRALLSAKALLYLYLQRRCLHSDDKGLTKQANLMGHQNQLLARPGNNGDPDLESTFHIIDWTFGTPSHIPWSELELSEPHRHWLSYILQYRAWDTIHRFKGLTEDVRGFVHDSLSRSTTLDRVAANCLFIICLMVGYQPKAKEELREKDRRSGLFMTFMFCTKAYEQRRLETTTMVDNIFSELEAQFEQGMSVDNIKVAAGALSLVAMVHDERIGEKSFTLFRKIMNVIKNDDPLWALARLSMKGAFSPIARAPRVDNLKMVLDFLHHHLSSQRRATFGDEPIYHSFRAIANSPDAEIRQGLARYDFTSPLFIGAIIEALSNQGYADLQEMAIVVLPELDSQLFTSDRAFQGPGKAQAFVESWWAAARGYAVGKPQRVHRAAAQVFFAIVNSPCLRKHIPPDAWKFTDTSHYILETNPLSLQRCTRNPDLLEFIREASPKVGLPSWMAVLWMERDSLPEDVLDQMEKVTREIVRKECEVSGEVTLLNRTRHCKTWIAIFDEYFERWEKRLSDLDPSDQAVLSLRTRLESVTRARKRLVEIQDEIEKAPPPARFYWDKA